MPELRGPGVDPTASIGDRAAVDRRASVGELARVGSGCVIGAGVFIGRNVLIGRNCTVRDRARVQESALIEDDVTIGTDAVIANSAGKHLAGVTVRSGAVVGDRARCVGPAVIGRGAVVEADTVVMADVPEHAVVAGSPAHLVGWIGRAGARLQQQPDGTWLCPLTGEYYVIDGDRLRSADAA